MISEKSFKVNPKEKLESKKRLVIISDTHISRYGGAFNLHAFNVGMEKINKIKDASVFLHLGDITQMGTLLDYEYALEQFKKFEPLSKNSKMIFLIGNHDAMNVGYLLFEEISNFKSKISGSWIHRSINISGVTVNSTIKITLIRIEYIFNSGK